MAEERNVKKKFEEENEPREHLLALALASAREMLVSSIFVFVAFKLLIFIPFPYFKIPLSHFIVIDASPLFYLQCSTSSQLLLSKDFNANNFTLIASCLRTIIFNFNYGNKMKRMRQSFYTQWIGQFIKCGDKSAQCQLHDAAHENLIAMISRMQLKKCTFWIKHKSLTPHHE